MDYLDTLSANTILVGAMLALTIVNVIVFRARGDSATNQRIARAEQSLRSAFNELEAHHGRILSLELDREAKERPTTTRFFGLDRWGRG